MSMLRERLLRHNKPSGNSPRAEAGALEAVATAVPANSLQAEALSNEQDVAQGGEWATIGAHMECNEWGSFVMRRCSYASQTLHGDYMLSELAGGAELLLALLPANGGEPEATAGFSHEQLLYLDIETTGLGIGAGNVAFMIGIGFYEGEQFIVEQMFIRDPGEELSMLHHLKEKLGSHPYLVTYNGKTFDWPIIKNRYILNRIRAEIPIAGHFDFLYPSRSLWKHTMPSCRLGKVEEEQLGVIRKDDVPGSLAPALYFQYLAERDVSIVEGVFIHNELDILSLAGLSVHFAKVLSGQSKLSAMGLEELYRLGVWLDKLSLSELAAQALELLEQRICGTEAPEPQEGSDSYLLPLAQLYKQRQRYADARSLWMLYVERKGERTTASVEPYIELSMHYEHREKQYSLALQYALQAVDQCWRQQALKRSFGHRLQAKDNGFHAKGRGQAAKAVDKAQLAEAANLEKRIQRLRQKIAKAESRAALSDSKPPARRRSRVATNPVEAVAVMDSLI
ncbi:ribonuclease H-like domain-containing protein [Paenibacillus agricola]|uniref:YprB ribonuclease H-like domain-containing protein n=1 Tax=Paenibacillus agricola TaxID=2716264 RepID=A0ABX0J4H7_9BACL|nr:ribonuclease H-like domain-containing protein [Paenibacillus agricola]NHN30726.1 hypothetical protein [Paenibacillus agricola]